jgi:transglutaminase-like putative cysteine protease
MDTDQALSNTRYCDFDHPAIQSLAETLKGKDDDPAVIAIRTFYYVRDQIVFGFNYYQRKASDVLKKGHGACWNKALLLVALLRCNHIPACLGSISVKRTFVKPAIGIWHWLANNPFNHCVVKVCLNDRWILIDAVLDTKTHAACFVPAGVQWPIDWDGENDVNLYTESVLGPAVVHPNIDKVLDNKVGNRELPKLLATIGYRYVNRTMWNKVKTHVEMSSCGSMPGQG